MISDLLCCFIANLFAKRFVNAIEKYKVDDSLSIYRFELSKLVATSEEKASIMPKTRLHVTLVLALLVFHRGEKCNRASVSVRTTMVKVLTT